MSIYTSIGFEGFKKILTIFVNIYSDSCLAVATILVRKGLLDAFPSSLIDSNVSLRSKQHKD
jgi:hypothetical protein